MEAVVTESGQVTIPPELREQLGLHPGTVIELEAVGGKLVGRLRDGEVEDPFEKWRGRGRPLPDNMTVDEYLRMARGVDGNR